MSEEADDSALCPVCMESYSESGDAVPRLLPCTHTMCHACAGRLIKNNTLVCPQDRKPHPAPSGVTTFPQNKYILKMLKQSKTTAVPPGGSSSDRCTVHGMDMMLYCKHPDCQKAICPLCLAEQHRGHTVVNIEEPRMSVLKSKAAVMKQRLSLDLSRLVATRERVHQQRLELMKRVNERGKKLLEEFDKKIRAIEDSIKKLNEINQHRTNDMEQDDFEKNTKLLETLQKQSEDDEPMKYKFYDDLEETTREMEPPGEATEVKNPQLLIEVVKSLKIRTKEMTEVTGITMLSDGSLLIYGSNRYVSNPRRILQYDWNTEDIIYAKDVDTKGAIEIRKDGYPFLLVSDGTTRLKLLETSNLAKCCQTINIHYKVAALYLRPPDHILFETIDGNMLMCAKIDSMRNARSCAYLQLKDRKDMCFLEDQDMEELSMTLFFACSDEVLALNHQGGFLWSFSGAPLGMVYGIKPTSITADQKRENLYVCDSANKCIQIISTDGVYQGCLVRRGEYELGIPTFLKWNKDTNSLLVVHTKQNGNHVSILTIQD